MMASFSLRAGAMRALIAFVPALAAAPSLAQVSIPIGARVGAVPAAPGTGLHGSVHASGTAIGNFATASAVIDGSAASATFLASTVDYPKGATDVVGDPRTLAQFLGSDAGSISGNGALAMARVAFIFRGYLAVRGSDDADPVLSGIQIRFAVASDDGFRLSIGDLAICEFDGTRGFTPSPGTASFGSEGLYPIELVYWEDSWDQGIEFLSSIAGGADIGGAAGRPLGVPTGVLYPTAQVVPAGTAGFHNGDLAGAGLGTLSDGTFLPAGANPIDGAVRWTAPSTTSIVFSFASAHDCVGATVQADGDDAYLLQAIPAGSSGYSDVWSIPTSAAGTGMRTRPNDADVTQRLAFAAPIRSTTFRIAATAGSAPYALSEVALFGRRARLASGAAPAGVTRFWTGPNGGFSTPGNWNGGVVPRSEDIARFDAASSSTSYAVSLVGAVETRMLVARKGAVSLDLNGFDYVAAQEVQIGRDLSAAGASGKLTLSDGRVIAGGLIVGAGNGPSRGILVVDGAQFLKPSCCDTAVGMGTGNVGELTVRNGGLVDLGAGFHSIAREGATGSVVVESGGQLLATGSDYHVAATNATGALTIQSGGRFRARALVVAGTDGSAGTLTVEGAGSEAIGLAGVGMNGTAAPSIGSVTVRAGGRISSMNAEGFGHSAFVGFGPHPSCLGRVRIEGVGSRWDTISRLTIGGVYHSNVPGRGELEILDGGLVQAVDLVVADQSLNTGLITIDGPDSRLEIANNAWIGDDPGQPAGVADLVIRNGGRLVAGSLSCGVGARIEVTVNGTGLPSIAVSGNAALDGSFTLGFAPGFTLAAGQSISVLSAASISGSFDAVSLPPGLEASFTGGQFVVRRPSVPTGLVIAPSAIEVPIGFERSLAATLLSSDGSALDVTSSAVWSVSPVGPAALPGPGRIRGLATGTAVVTATYGGFSATAGVAVLSTSGFPASQLLSVRADGVQTSGAFYDLTAVYPSMTSDGSMVFFDLSEPGALLPQRPDALATLVKERATGVLRTPVLDPDFSDAVTVPYDSSTGGDGRFVSYTRLNEFRPGEFRFDVFVQDRQTGATECITPPAAGEPAPSFAYAVRSRVSDDGRFVAFISGSGDLVAGDPPQSTGVDGYLYVRDRQTATTKLVRGLGGAVPNAPIDPYIDVSADGRWVVFDTTASNLVPGDANGTLDVFLYDAMTDAVERVSVGSGEEEGSDWSFYGLISDDGSRIVFRSAAQNLNPSPNGIEQIYLRDRDLGTTRILSLRTDGQPFPTFAASLAFSGNGRFIAFRTDAQLVPADQNATSDAYRLSVATGAIELVSASALDGRGVGGSRYSALNRDGSVVAFLAASSELAPNDTNGALDFFARVMPVPPIVDCDDDGRTDAEEIALGAPDCDGNAVPDACDLALHPERDFNGNGVLDACEGVSGWIGGASGAFELAANWSGGVPGAATEVLLAPAPGGTVELLTGGARTIASLSVRGGLSRIRLGGTLTVAGDLAIEAGASLVLDGSLGPRLLDVVGNLTVARNGTISVGPRARVVCGGLASLPPLSTLRVAIRTDGVVPFYAEAGAFEGAVAVALGDLSPQAMLPGDRFTIVRAAALLSEGFYSVLSAPGLGGNVLARAIGGANLGFQDLVLEVEELQDLIQPGGGGDEPLPPTGRPTSLVARNFTVPFDPYDDVAVTVRFTDGNGNAVDGSLYVLRTDGEGGVAEQATYPTGVDPAAVDSEDYDGDGTLDLVVACETDSTLQLFLNPVSTVDGFVAGAEADTEAGPFDVSTVVVEALAPLVARPVVVLANRSARSMQTFVIAGGVILPGSIRPLPRPTGPANPIRDVDREDGVVVQTLQAGLGGVPGGTGTVEIVRIGVNGEMTLLQSLDGPAEPTDAEGDDLNSDGLGDVSVSDATGRVTVYPATALGYATSGGIPLGLAALDATAGDLDGDGRPDLAVALGEDPGPDERGTKVALLRNTSQPGADPTFSSAGYVYEGKGIRRIRSGHFDDSKLAGLVGIGETLEGALLAGGGVGSPFVGIQLFVRSDAPFCFGDVNFDRVIDAQDLGALLSDWGGVGSGDVDNSGIVDAQDLGILLSGWGACP